MKTRIALAAALSLAAGSAAMGDTISAKFSIPWNPGNNTSFSFLPAGSSSLITLSVPAVSIKGMRQDMPIGPGEFAGIDSTFLSFCVEVSENIGVSVNGAGGTKYLFDVIPLLGASTTSAATTGITTFDGLRTQRLERLWAGVDMSKVWTDQTYAAAFQVAQWKIAFESKSGALNLFDNTSRMNTGLNNAINSLAQTMLDQVDLPGPQVSLVLLRAEGVQDQITMLVPTPGAGALALLGGLVLTSRRRGR